MRSAIELRVSPSPAAHKFPFCSFVSKRSRIVYANKMNLDFIIMEIILKYYMSKENFDFPHNSFRTR